MTAVNSNPKVSLMLFFVVPRCLTYIAFISVSESIVKIVSSSLEKAKYTAQIEEFQAKMEKKVAE